MELLDVYDKNRNRKNKWIEKNKKTGENEFILIAHLCIFNKKNEMLIQKRAESKLDFPGMWDISSGGGAMKGEESFQTASREALEELGLDIDLKEARPFLTIHYDKGFDDYYFADLDLEIKELKIQEAELTDIAWADKHKILGMMKQGEFIRYNDGFIDLLFSMRQNRGTYPPRKDMT